MSHSRKPYFGPPIRFPTKYTFIFCPQSRDEGSSLNDALRESDPYLYHHNLHDCLLDMVAVGFLDTFGGDRDNRDLLIRSTQLIIDSDASVADFVDRLDLIFRRSLNPSWLGHIALNHIILGPGDADFERFLFPDLYDLNDVVPFGMKDISIIALDKFPVTPHWIADVKYIWNLPSPQGDTWGSPMVVDEKLNWLSKELTTLNPKET